MNQVNGSKTYILAALAAVSALCLYVSGVLQHGFDISEFIKFINTEAIAGAFAAVRHAISKK